MKEKMFPVLNQQSCRISERKQMPREVPWRLVEPHSKQIWNNHDQTLERLAQRGGLAPEELYLAFHGRSFSDRDENGKRKTIDEQVAIDWCWGLLML